MPVGHIIIFGHLRSQEKNVSTMHPPSRSYLRLYSHRGGTHQEKGQIRPKKQEVQQKRQIKGTPGVVPRWKLLGFEGVKSSQIRAGQKATMDFKMDVEDSLINLSILEDDLDNSESVGSKQ